MQGLDKNVYRNIMMTFSAQTNANQVQDIIDTKLDKRRKQVFGPPVGSRCVVFVDDLNMPALETYGAQTPIEILRQWMDHGGWYDREENCVRSIVDIQFVAAMGPPGGGRNHVTPRYLRHFNLLYIVDLDDSSLTTVFETVIQWWLRKCKLPHEMNVSGKHLVAATINIYRAIQRELLPTPAKSHCTYNMRDISKVFQGLAQVNVVADKGSLVQLWCHESLRVFHDRLVNDEDRRWFMEYMQAQISWIKLPYGYCHSSFGDAFRTPLRMFPSLVNCCTIDWFSEWPAEALKSVAPNFIATMEMDWPQIGMAIVGMCQMFHLDAQRLSLQFFEEQQRHFYITPTSFLELLGTYKQLLNQKRAEITTMKNRYSGGLKKLFGAEEQVSVMKEELEGVQPILLKTAEDTNTLLKKIAADRKEKKITGLSSYLV